MEKKALVLLSLGLVLGLASCGGEPTESTTSSTTEDTTSDTSVPTESTTSSTTEDTTSDTSVPTESTPDSSTPTESTPTESEPEASSSEIIDDTPAWDAETEAGLETITYGHVPPATDALVDAGAYLAIDYDENVLLYAEGIDYTAVTEWADALVDAGYVDNTDLYAANYVIQPGEIVLDVEYDDGVQIQIDIYFVDSETGDYVDQGTGDMYGYIFASKALLSFPTQEINAMLEDYYGVTDIDIPAFDADEYAVFEPSADYPFIEVDGYTDTDPTVDYTAALGAAGWVYNDTLGSYVDPTGTLALEFEYSASYGVFYITIELTPDTEWPTDLIGEVLSTYFGADGVTMPVLEGADYYEVITSYYDYFGIVAISCYGIEAADAYNAALLDAGWTYDSANDMYIDPTGTIAAYAMSDTDYTEIGIMAAPAPLATEFPADELAAILAENGIEGVTIPAPEGEFEAYDLVDDYVAYGFIRLDCYCSTDYTASYGAQLEAAGWTYSETEGTYLVEGNESIAIALDYYGDYGYMKITIYIY